MVWVRRIAEFVNYLQLELGRNIYVHRKGRKLERRTEKMLWNQIYTQTIPNDLAHRQNGNTEAPLRKRTKLSRGALCLVGRTSFAGLEIV